MRYCMCIKSAPGGPPTEQPEATVVKRCGCSIKKKSVSWTKSNSSRRTTEEQCLLTKPFYRNSNVIYAHFNEGKDNYRFYFIPLYLEMIYCLAGIVSKLAPDRVWLCSFIRCTLEQPNLFQYKCPKCGKTVLSFRYLGSPLSGRVDLEGYCDCGWRGFESVSGWFVWG